MFVSERKNPNIRNRVALVWKDTITTTDQIQMVNLLPNAINIICETWRASLPSKWWKIKIRFYFFIFSAFSFVFRSSSGTRDSFIIGFNSLDSQNYCTIYGKVEKLFFIKWNSRVTNSKVFLTCCQANIVIEFFFNWTWVSVSALRRI